MSAPIPATSPTLSPTLSAMPPGLRGSSSGMPSTTLPAMSEPTSAGLRVDAAADAREERDRGGADREAVEHGREVRVVRVDVVETAETEKRRRGDEEAHHGAAVERRQQRVRLRAFAGGLTRSHIRVGRGLHADEARKE